MLIYVSFTAYLSYSAGVMLLYYSCVWFLFYSKKPSAVHASMQSPGLTQPLIAQPVNSPDTFPHVHDLVDELNALLLQLDAEKADKEQVAAALQRLLQKYPMLKGSDYQPSINHLVGVETENKCGLHFSAEELLALWD